MSVFKSGPRISAPQPPSRSSLSSSGKRGGTLTRPPAEEAATPPYTPPPPTSLTPTPPPPDLAPPPGPPPLPALPPPPVSSPHPPAISPRGYKQSKVGPKPEFKAAVKVIMPVAEGGFGTVMGHSNMSLSEVIAAAMGKFYKGKGVGEETEEMKSLIRNACATLALASIDKGALLPHHDLLVDHLDPKVDPTKTPLLKFEFKLIRTREITDEERKAVENAKQSKIAADNAALQEAKDKEAAELADAQDDTKFEGPQTATIDELFARMMDYTKTPELEMRSAFCLNYVGFMTGVDVIARIFELYDRPLSAYTHPDTNEVAPRAFFLAKQRVIEFVKTWVEEFPEDFKSILDEKEKEYKEFLTRLGTTDSVTTDPVIRDAVAICGPTYKGLTDQIDNVKIRIHFILKTKVSRVTGVIVPPSLIEYPLCEVPADRMGILLTTPIEDLVAQFHRMDYNCLSMINMRELTNKWWTRKQVEKCPNVTRMIDIYNQRSYWVASACLTSPKAEERAHCIGLFIKLVRALLDSHNYFGATGILNGLLQSPLGPNRLKLTWDKVSQKKKAMFAEMTVECDRKKNFAVYRTNYAQASTEGKACIPNLVVVLQDLYQLEEVPTRVETTGHINWHKFGKEWRQAQRVILKQISQPVVHTRVMTPEQEREFRRVGSVLTTVLAHCRLDEEQLWDLSFIHEPKSEEHKLQTQWKGYTQEQKQAVHEEELKKVWLVWGPILEARRQRFEKDRLLREEEHAKMAEAMKRLALMRTEWTKDEKKGLPPLIKAWNDPTHSNASHVCPDYLSISRPHSRPPSFATFPDELHRTLTVDGADLRDGSFDVSPSGSPHPDGSIRDDSSRRATRGESSPETSVSHSGAP